MLEIFAVKNVRYLGDPFNDIYNYRHQPHVFVIAEHGYQERLDGFKQGAYGYEAILESYITNWRDFPLFISFLAQAIVNRSDQEIRENREDPLIKELPFYQLIDLVHFGLRNGTVGPVTAKKLMRDFFTYQNIFLTKISELKPENGELFVETYNALIKQFAFACENGFVIFT